MAKLYSNLDMVTRRSASRLHRARTPGGFAGLSLASAATAPVVETAAATKKSVHTSFSEQVPIPVELALVMALTLRPG